ncbi:EAL domain-containing protein [Chitinibacter bivalviorum]|uniref:EAL domain-containing protein n=1 Tax=Chitinibacter bivalviorum TaxID=2739434 RepID=A0A7H9BIR7_9NEIS|nr:EAL domain-containing protein [Chitinibacter bivalviorum]QLG87454.1 EAL domain-containing protein [Chitinibacter bivalviorum]
MSLFRQVWLMIIASAVMAFIVALLVSTLSARDYLQTQLYTQSSDNASSLALSISQQANDPAMIELMSNALFDSGHFELIRITDPHGKIINELHNKDLPSDVPSWFIARFPISVSVGTALITNGWKQAGKVEIQAHSRFAYESLWKSAQKLFIWMLLGGIATGALMHIVLRRIRAPILQIMAQAAAISERRFINVPQPRYIELRPMADAMNSMVDRVKAMLDEQTAHIEELKRDANRDPVTGLANRSFFMGRLADALSSEESLPLGVLYMLRLKDLAGINRDLGRQATDKLLTELATELAHHADSNEGWQAARLNGSDFVLFAPGQELQADFAEKLLGSIAALAPTLSNFIALGYSSYAQGDGIGAVLSRTDGALAQAESQMQNNVAAAAYAAIKASRPNDEWLQILQKAIEAQHFVAASFAVLDFNGQSLHQEMVLRLPDPATGELQSAGVFMPFAARFNLLPALDLAAVQLGLKMLSTQSADIAINIAPQSISNVQFRRDLATLLNQQSRESLMRLWLEVNESALIDDLESLSTFITEMRKLGVKVGIEHFGRQVGSMPKLYDLPLSYLKIDSSYIHDIDQQSNNQQLIKAIMAVTKALNIMTIAELVRTEGEWSKLQQLGLNGATGPVTQLKMKI